MTEFEKLQRLVAIQRTLVAAAGRVEKDIAKFRQLAAKTGHISQTLLREAYEVQEGWARFIAGIQQETRYDISKQVEKVTAEEIAEAGKKQLEQEVQPDPFVELEALLK